MVWAYIRRYNASLRISLQLTFVLIGLLTYNFQGAFRINFFFKSSSLKNLPKPLQISSTRTLVEPYTKISLIQLQQYWIIGISRLSCLATGHGFLDSALSYQ